MNSLLRHLRNPSMFDLLTKIIPRPKENYPENCHDCLITLWDLHDICTLFKTMITLLWKICLPVMTLLFYLLYRMLLLSHRTTLSFITTAMVMAMVMMMMRVWTVPLLLRKSNNWPMDTLSAFNVLLLPSQSLSPSHFPAQLNPPHHHHHHQPAAQSQALSYRSPPTSPSSSS